LIDAFGNNPAHHLFTEAVEIGLCVIFIDGIDALGSTNSKTVEQRRTVQQLLIEMDGLKNHPGIIVVAATDQPQNLDPALMRSGYFDVIDIPLPDAQERLAILKLHAHNFRIDRRVDLNAIAQEAQDLSGGELVMLLNDAALLAEDCGRQSIQMMDLEAAFDLLTETSDDMSTQNFDAEKRIIAAHEAGHALIATLLPEAGLIHRATIGQHSGIGGKTVIIPRQGNLSKTELEAYIAFTLAGRVAEVIISKTETTGACEDLEQATETANGMVRKWGMSALGARSFSVSKKYDTGSAALSEETLRKIDQEISAILDQEEKRVTQLLTQHIAALHRLTEALIEYETLRAEEIRAIIEMQAIINESSALRE
jgi:cell division protease FtsH